MPRVLVIDDDPIYHKIIARGLQPLGYEVEIAEQGRLGIQKAQELQPDVIITDVVMPDMSGYEVARQLRRNPAFSTTPILVLSSQSGLQAKLDSFEAGADDYITKPFEPAELAARLTALLRRAEQLRATLAVKTVREKARLLAIHSLRGGVGCTSLAVNLAISLQALWNLPTILLDLNLVAGQVALMLNSTIKRTWADLSQIPPDELDMSVLSSVTNKHESGLAFISAPASPSEAELISRDLVAATLRLFEPRYAYIVADLPHDFSAPVLTVLDAADVILMVLSPEMASIRAAAAALDIYQKLNYPPDKIKVVVNATFPKRGLPKEKIETALSVPVMATIPYSPEVFVDAINYGRPIVYTNVEDPIAGLLEDMAFLLSKDIHKKVRPEAPTEAWQRVYRRFQARRK
ncbi:MAG: response regulator [Anaerolineales bacterium]|nr:response regulator [Anaerolineales bacterium]MCX7608889.1 response regulator [Anaerolineales bacterium]MDW8227468.1 response regulator [Anaerolineales bacterium]